MAPPDFLCIGAHKAGTDWLYAMLAQNPGVFLPPVKEIHFFDFVRVPENRWWIRRMFGKTATRASRRRRIPGFTAISTGSPRCRAGRSLVPGGLRPSGRRRAGRRRDHPGLFVPARGRGAPRPGDQPGDAHPLRHPRPRRPGAVGAADERREGGPRPRIRARGARRPAGGGPARRPQRLSRRTSSAGRRSSRPGQLLYLPYRRDRAPTPQRLFCRGRGLRRARAAARYAALGESVHRSRPVAIDPAVQDDARGAVRRGAGLDRGPLRRRLRVSRGRHAARHPRRHPPHRHHQPAAGAGEEPRRARGAGRRLPGRGGRTTSRWPGRSTAARAGRDDGAGARRGGRAPAPAGGALRRGLRHPPGPRLARRRWRRASMSGCVFYLRRQDHWLMSWYNQHVKWPFDREKSRMDPQAFLATLEDFHWLDYERLLGRWSAVLGAGAGRGRGAREGPGRGRHRRLPRAAGIDPRRARARRRAGQRQPAGAHARDRPPPRALRAEGRQAHAAPERAARAASPTGRRRRGSRPSTRPRSATGCSPASRPRTARRRGASSGARRCSSSRRPGRTRPTGASPSSRATRCSTTGSRR